MSRCYKCDGCIAQWSTSKPDWCKNDKCPYRENPIKDMTKKQRLAFLETQLKRAEQTGETHEIIILLGCINEIKKLTNKEFKEKYG